MRLLKLKLRGMIGIKKGLGLDEIEIDFTQFQPGLIALTGKNGTGKTSVMESLHPYRCMVSRSGSLQSHFFLKDSYRMLEFEQNGNIYKAQIYIDGLTGASEAYLFEQIPHGFNPLNDGKLTTYDYEIEKLLGSQELFFNSVFSGQKSKGIAELKPADRRKLFYELLNLNIYDQYLENAKSNLKQSEIKLAGIESQINSLDVSEETKNELEEARVQALDGIADAEISISKVEEEIKQIDSAIRDAEIEIAKLEEKQKANDEISIKRNAIKKKSDELQTTFDKKLLKLNSDLQDSKKLILNYENLLSRKDEIDLNVTRIQNLEANIQNAKNLKTEFLEKDGKLQKFYSDETQKISQMSKELDSSIRGLDNIENLITNNVGELENCNKQSSLISEVPCTEEVGFQCQFLKNAYDSKKMIGAHQENILTLQKEFDSLKNEIEKETKIIDSKKQLLDESYQLDSKHISDHLEKINSDLKEWEASIDPIVHYKELAEQLKTAETEVKVLNEKITNISAQIEDSRISHEKQLEELSKESFELLAKFDSNISEKIDECNDVLHDKEIDKDDANIVLASFKNSLDTFKRNLQQTEIQIDELKKNEEKLADLYLKKSSVQNEIKDWTFLTKAFDKTGIPVLKLENSGIEITTIANELLSLFENKFRIVFETTKLKADKKNYKESFDINIVEEDGVCEISNKSGGQQVWLETAIQSAISLVVRQQGRNIQTSFLDEKDGALDLENAYSYVEMIRKAHQMSGVHNTFIITHRTELLDFIPQQIKLADGLLTILN